MLPHEQLAAKADDVRARQKANAKASYAYARHLGFTSYEAQIMAKWTLKRIEEYAKGRATAGDNNG